MLSDDRSKISTILENRMQTSRGLRHRTAILYTAGKLRSGNWKGVKMERR